MVRKYTDTKPVESSKVEQLFDRIAWRYDLINDLQSFGLHRLWKRRVLKLASVRPGDPALDLCCGTGDVSFALARHGADVIGIDFSERMLAVAEQRKSRSRGMKVPEFICGDALQISFPDNTFDIVTVCYGLRNLASWQRGLREMWRVARPGGRLLVLDFGKPDNAAWRGIYFGYLKFFVPLLGAVFCGDRNAYAYILKSLEEYPAQRGVAEEMGKLRLINVKVLNLVGGAMSINYGEKSGR